MIVGLEVIPFSSLSPPPLLSFLSHSLHTHRMCKNIESSLDGIQSRFSLS